MRRFLGLGLLAWVAYWVAGELTLRAGGGKLPPWLSFAASKSTSGDTD
jgi:hypothetical protein